MSEMVERVALAMWRKREVTFPGFTRRMEPDDLDRASGAWAAMCELAQAAIEAMRPVRGPLRDHTSRAVGLAMEREGLRNISIGAMWAVQEAFIDAALREMT